MSRVCDALKNVDIRLLFIIRNRFPAFVYLVPNWFLVLRTIRLSEISFFVVACINIYVSIDEFYIKKCDRESVWTIT